MSAFSLKMIALVFMFLDHVAEFIPGTPIVFRWMGRISAPVFIYCCVWSFEFKGFESLIFKEEMRAKVVFVELLLWMLFLCF